MQSSDILPSLRTGAGGRGVTVTVTDVPKFPWPPSPNVDLIARMLHYFESLAWLGEY